MGGALSVRQEHLSDDPARLPLLHPRLPPVRHERRSADAGADHPGGRFHRAMSDPPAPFLHPGARAKSGLVPAASAGQTIGDPLSPNLYPRGSRRVDAPTATSQPAAKRYRGSVAQFLPQPQ